MTPFPADACPICGARPANGKLEHDQAAHDRRKAEDWRPSQLEGQRERVPTPGLYDPPGERHIPPYVRNLIERRPDLKEQILAEYHAGLNGERVEAPEQPELPLKRDDPELTPPRRVFGYGDDD